MNFRLFLTITIIFGSMTPSIFYALEQDPFMCKVPRGEHEKAHKQNTLMEESHKKEQFDFVCTDSYEISNNGVPAKIHHMEGSLGEDLFVLSYFRGKHIQVYAINPRQKTWKLIETDAIVSDGDKNRLVFSKWLDDNIRMIFWNAHQDCTSVIPGIKSPCAIERDAFGRSLCSVFCPNEIAIIDLQTKETIKKIAYEGDRKKGTALKKLHNNRMMYAINGEDGSIITGFLDSDEMQTLPPHTHGNESLEKIYLYEDRECRTTIIERTAGETIYGSVYLHDAISGVMCSELVHPKKVRHIEVKEIEGRVFVATISGLDIITLWDVTNRGAPNKITAFKEVKVDAIALYQDALGHICIATAEDKFDGSVFRNMLNIWKPAVRKTHIETIKKELPKLPGALQNMVLEYAGAHEYALQNDGGQERPALPESSIGQSDLLEGKLKNSEPLPSWSWHPIKVYAGMALGFVSGAALVALWLKYKNR